MAPRKNSRGYDWWMKSDHRFDHDTRTINEPCDCSYPALYNRKNAIHRVRCGRLDAKKLNIPKLVYKFLGNVASLGSKNNEVNSSRSNFQSGSMKKIKKRQRNLGAVNVATNRHTSSETNSTIRSSPTSTPRSTTSAIKTRQKFSIQAIKDYIKAGIAEGKRRAKKYMCNALSFGVDTGYLIPCTDSEDGQVLRVSSALVSFTGQKDNGERRIRQRLRRGDATCTSQERKLLRRRGPDVVPQKRPRSPSSVGSSSSTSRKQSPVQPRRKKPKYRNRIRRYKPRDSKKRRSRRRPRGRINSVKMNAENSRTHVKLEKEINEDSNCQRERLTPSRSKEDNAKSIKKEKLSYPSIEENSSEVTKVKEK